MRFKYIGVSSGPIQFKSARKNWPLLELHAKITRVLAGSCSQNFYKCSRARIGRKNKRTARMFAKTIRYA